MVATYGERLSVPAHRSFFRDAIARRAAPLPVHEYLIDQANLRGFFGAYSSRSESDKGPVDPDLESEDIVVGLLQPHAPAEARVVKLIVRILQSGQLDPTRLWLRARRERADACLAWVLDLVPEPERNVAVREIAAALEVHSPRQTRRPRFHYAPERLVRRKASLS
ncbi:MAG: hypothetical protein IT384_28595 [Deltaproteobacteria bacterium]|nr:hypothetical protein [Deltaproteobacteria bacterium]